MGERKVLNNYYPPDFDPSKLPRLRRPKNQQIKVRMMLPMSVRCNTCGNYIYMGTKFNSRKEDVIGEKYLGIQLFRFYSKCTNCCAELTMKTDPHNSDYVVESGACRIYEPWHEEVDKDKQKRDAEEMGDAMKSLENRTLDSKRDMDIIAALDEMKSMKSRHANLSVDAMLAALQRTGADKVKRIEDEEDEAVVKSIFGKQKEVIRRTADEEFDDDDTDDDDAHGDDSLTLQKEMKGSKKRKALEDILTSSSADNPKEPKKQVTSKQPFKSVHITVIKKQSQPISSTTVAPPKPDEKDSVANTSLSSLFHNYGSDEDED